MEKLHESLLFSPATKSSNSDKTTFCVSEGEDAVF